MQQSINELKESNDNEMLSAYEKRVNASAAIKKEVESLERDTLARNEEIDRYVVLNKAKEQELIFLRLKLDELVRRTTPLQQD